MSNNYSNTEPYLSNPFADTTEDPFRDPAVFAARNASTTHTLYDDDSPPLENVQLESIVTENNSTQLSERERELSEREARIAERERALQQQAEILRIHGGRKPNFPPFYPIYYMDIQVEIPEANRNNVRLLFQSWLAYAGVLVINFVTSILILASKPSNLTSTTSNFGTALSYMIVMPILAFLFWYRPIYNAFMKERAYFYFIFFLFNGFHILFVAYLTVGIPGTGSCGIISSIYVLADGKIVISIFGFITAGLLGALTLLNSILFLRVHRHCQAVGHSFSDAKSEAVAKATRSETARNAATGYARQQFSA